MASQNKLVKIWSVKNDASWTLSVAPSTSVSKVCDQICDKRGISMGSLNLCYRKKNSTELMPLQNQESILLQVKDNIQKLVGDFDFVVIDDIHSQQSADDQNNSASRYPTSTVTSTTTTAISSPINHQFTSPSSNHHLKSPSKSENVMSPINSPLNLNKLENHQQQHSANNNHHNAVNSNSIEIHSPQHVIDMGDIRTPKKATVAPWSMKMNHSNLGLNYFYYFFFSLCLLCLFVCEILENIET